MNITYYVRSLKTGDICGHQHKSHDNAIVCQRRLAQYHCCHGYVSGLNCNKCGGIAKKQDYIDKWHNSVIQVNDINQLFTPKNIED